MKDALEWKGEIMKDYIGTKIIKAEPMDENMFLEQFKGKAPWSLMNRDTRPGYHVRYPDGYDSWSPQAVFEAAYRLVTEDEFKLLEFIDDSAEKRKEHFRAGRRSEDG